MLRKGAHVTEYAMLALLLVRALGREVPAFALGVLYAASDEFHQSFVRGRHAAPLDVAIDAVGVLIGLTACGTVRPPKSSRATFRMSASRSRAAAPSRPRLRSPARPTSRPGGN